MNSQSTTEEKILEELKSKYGAFELCDVVSYGDLERLTAFLLSAMSSVRADERARVREIGKSIRIVLDFVERWNKQDKEQDVAEAQGKLDDLLSKLSTKTCPSCHKELQPDLESKNTKGEWDGHIF